MGVLLAVIAAAALYIGLPGMFEPKDAQEAAYFSLGPALKATFINRSFVAVGIAQTMRFFATNTLASGMIFYMKYSIGADEALTSLILAVAFVAAGLALWPWRQLVANRFEPRTTLMLAYILTGLAVIPLGFAQTLVAAVLCAVLVGIALAGLILMGDVIMADVVDEDEVKTGQRRAGMYFGMFSLITTLSGALVSVVFGLLLPAYGYDTSLMLQPPSVGTGFRVFMTVPALIGSALAVVALTFYPLHGVRLQEIKSALAAKAGKGGMEAA